MINDVIKKLQNHTLVISIWAVLLLSPLFGTLRLFYVNNSESIPSFLKSVSTFLFILPFIIPIVSLVILVVWLKKFLDSKFTNGDKKIFVIIFLLSLLLFVIARFLLYLEDSNFPNFVYSQIGLTVSQLHLFSFTGSAHIISFISCYVYDRYARGLSKKFIKRSENKSRVDITLTWADLSFFIAVIGVFILFAFSLESFLKYSLWIKDSKQGFEGKVGEVYKYIEIVVKHTPENAYIIHPPQGEKWPAIGNQPLVRYFYYPRGLISGALIDSDSNSPKLDNLYLIEIYSDNAEARWPLIDSKNKKIVLDDEHWVDYKVLDTVYKNDFAKVYRILFN